MGLDQTIYSDTRQHPKDAVDIDGIYKLNGLKEIHYFRKHHDLQGWMSNLADRRGANMHWNSMTESVVLSMEDLDKLEEAVTGNNLPLTEGFFFGADNTEYYKQETLYMIEKARSEIDAGKSIIYTCSW